MFCQFSQASWGHTSKRRVFLKSASRVHFRRPLEHLSRPHIARDIGLRSWPIFGPKNWQKFTKIDKNWQKFTKIDKNSQKFPKLYTHFSLGRKWLQTWSRGLRKSTPEREFSHVLCFITFQLLHIENRPNIYLTLENWKFCWFSENNTSTLTANFSA